MFLFEQRADPVEDGGIESDGAQDQHVEHGCGRIAAVFEEREREAPRDPQDDGDEAFAEEPLCADEVRAEEEVEAGEDEGHFQRKLLLFSILFRFGV